jgi:XTP/dITP diphosphohydrolase
VTGRGPGTPPAAGLGPTPGLTVVLATANPDKVAEITAILAEAAPVEILPRPAGLADVAETGDTLEANARLKALAVAAAAGHPAMADDTGLEVDALGGAPGVYSARYAGEGVSYADNVAKLLAELGALPDGGGARRARFRTVALVAWPDGREILAEGTVEGRIAAAASGDRGFGYDPVFEPDQGDGRTFAEMTSDEKHAVSHRGRAFRALAALLADLP